MIVITDYQRWLPTPVRRITPPIRTGKPVKERPLHCLHLTPATFDEPAPAAKPAAKHDSTRNGRLMVAATVGFVVLVIASTVWRMFNPS